MLNKNLGLAVIFECTLIIAATNYAKNPKGTIVVMDLTAEAATTWLLINKTVVENVFIQRTLKETIPNNFKIVIEVTGIIQKQIVYQNTSYALITIPSEDYVEELGDPMAPSCMITLNIPIIVEKLF